MPGAWTQNFYHAVWSTRGRTELISFELESRLHPFLGGILKDLRCMPLAINGMADHVHILTRYPSNLAHSDLLRHLKHRSSAWIHDEIGQREFAWQEGYGGFTVSKSIVPQVQHYIRNQKERHAMQSYRDEVIELHRLYDMELIEEDVFR
jgi:REP element-mobilizing transposase RayT